MARRLGCSASIPICGPDLDARVLLETRAIQSLQSRSVRADQRQVQPWPRDQRSAGIVAPAQLEETGFLDHDGFPPRRPSALGFGQHEMADIDVVPIFGQRLAVGGGICRDGFIVFCLD
jgi:hypothetical protein